MALTLTLGTGPSFGQNQLQFIKVNPTIEGAIQLNWASNPNEYYEIDYANEVLDQTQGGTIWLPLLEDYPSQGTNTLFLDTGNYFIDPAALHPSKSPMRFYRIVLSGTNTASAPFVSIVSPTNGDSVSDVIYVSVSASSDQPFVFTKLYVDGEEMQEASSTTNYLDNGTNYVLSTYILNTCEWPNGSHSLFATAECQSGPSGTHDIPAPLIGRAASTFVAVAYSNLVTRVAFSEPFFMPEDGQIQIVSAVFAANVNWTLQIQDANTNTVRTATGSGASMAFNWDGTGDGGTSLPVGNYTYLLAAQTNGEPLTHGQVRNKTLNGEVERIPPPPMPPVRVHGHFVPWQAVYGPVRVFPDTVLLPDEIASPPAPYGGSGSQSTRAPVRPPTAPTRGRGGFFGIAYDTYRGVASGYTVQNPDNGLNIGVKIGMEGSSGDHAFTYPVLREYISEAHNFITEMKRGN